MIAPTVIGTSHIWEKLLSKTCFKFSATILFALLQSKIFNIDACFKSFFQTTIIEMPSLIRKEKFTSEIGGTQITRNIIVRLKKKCSAQTL